MLRTTGLRSLVTPMLLACSLLQAQVRINEVCSKNATVLFDGDRTPDWIELHNAGDSPVNLAGYHLSDDPERPTKWRMPTLHVPANGYVVLFAAKDPSDSTRFQFRLSQYGETITLRNVTMDEIDRMRVPPLRPDHSYGRAAANPAEYLLFAEPTPGAANSSPGASDYARAPTFSVAAGLHDGPVTVVISGAADQQVHYTTNGSEPDQRAPLYNGPVRVDQNSSLKAKAYASGLLPSTTTVATYLIGERTQLPVVALSVHPDSLFHPELGLYVRGPNADTVHPYLGANYWSKRGLATHFEFFEADGSRKVVQEVELRIHGGSASRNKPQRPLRLTARTKYGSNRIHYPFFPERPDVSAFKRLVLRNSGSDWCLAHYRDGFFHQLSFHQQLDIDELGFRPAAIYINGQYWGILNIRERIDRHHLSLDHGAHRDSLLLMEEENVSIQGDPIHFFRLKEHILNSDLNDDAAFARVDSLLDLSSFTDYFALQIHAGNPDWPSNNIKYWKPSVHGGKWRYLLYDLDATMMADGWITYDFDMFRWLLEHRRGWLHAEIYRSLMKREAFRRDFLNRLADLMNTSLSSETYLRENDRIRGMIRSEVPRHFPRWGLPVELWDLHSGELIPGFARERAGHVHAQVLRWYDLPNTAELLFESAPASGGSIRVNTIEPPLPFPGIYFNGNAIDVRATAAPGFHFDHWEYSTADSVITYPGTHWQRSFPADGRLTAVFRTTNDQLTAFPNPFVNDLDVVVAHTRSGPTEVSVTDLQGRLVHRSVYNSGHGGHRLVLQLEHLVAGIYVVSARNNGMVQHTRVIKQ